MLALASMSESDSSESSFIFIGEMGYDFTSPIGLSGAAIIILRCCMSGIFFVAGERYDGCDGADGATLNGDASGGADDADAPDVAEFAGAGSHWISGLHLSLVASCNADPGTLDAAEAVGTAVGASTKPAPDFVRSCWSYVVSESTD